VTEPPAHRQVRATPAFFDQLDAQLPAERTARRPSRSDFDAYDLLPVVDRFASGWDTLPELIPGRPEYRVLISTGQVVPALTVIGQLAPDGAVELIRVEIDLAPPWTDDADDED